MSLTQLLQKLFSPMRDCEAAALQLCRAFRVPVTKTNIKEQLEEHPDYPSLLAMSDILKDRGIENIALKINIEDLGNYDCPFIAQVSLVVNGIRDKYFCVITSVNNGQVVFYHPEELKETHLPLEEFEKIFTGYVLLAEATETAGEKDYRLHRSKENRLLFYRIIGVSAIPAVVLAACAWVFLTVGSAAVWAIIYTLLTLAGMTVGALLMWVEIDQHNPALNQICHAGKKTSCAAVALSKGSKIFGISWAVIGFSFFVGNLICLLATGIYNLPMLCILSWFNVLALPYIAYSISYQGLVVKRWCVLCLTVQTMLALQFAVTFLGGFHTAAGWTEILTTNTVSLIVAAFLIPFLAVSMLLPALQKAKENRQNKMALQRLKNNPQIFEALLKKQKEMTESAEGLGISLGRQDAKFKLVKVCNPYCGPCARAHPIMEALLENNPDLQLQILFTATEDEKDFKTPPAKHLLAVAAQGDEAKTKQALDDWYLAERKDYEAFAAKYPMNGELPQQSEAIKAMSEWCNKWK